MNASPSRSARVAISACSVEQRFRLEAMLERNGWYVIINAPLKTAILSRLNDVRPDALVVDLENASDHDLEVLKFLLPRCTIPVLITDDEIHQALTSETELGERFNEKLEAAIERRFVPDAFDRKSPATERAEAVTAALRLSVEPSPAAMPEPVGVPPVPALSQATEIPPVVPSNVIETPYFTVGAMARAEPEPARAVADTKRAGTGRPGSVWVLGASLGGPQAVARFLSGIPPELDVAFVLVQRIGPQYVPILVKQLNNSCAFDVLPAADGHIIRSGDVIVAPVDQRVSLGEDGKVKLLPAAQAVGVSALDHAMQAIARRYRAHAGAIVFSGMGDDGIKGCHAVLDHGGTVWTQDPDSCVIDSMPKHVRHACKIEISADPESLAAHLVEKLSVQNYVRAGGASG